MKRAIVISILLSFIMGCGHTKVWYSPAKTVEETELDVKECKKRAEQPQEPPKITSRPGYPTDQASQAKEKIQRVEDCLKAKGYRIVEKEYLDSQGKDYYDAAPF